VDGQNRVSSRTVPSRCPYCPRGPFVRLEPTPPEVEPTFRFLPVTQVVEVGGRVVLGLVCGRCQELLAEGERPLALKAELRHDSRCAGAPEVLEVTAEPYQRTAHNSNRRFDGATISARAGCQTCGLEVTMETAVELRRSEYDVLQEASV
jgi:hypothetical protein